MPNRDILLASFAAAGSAELLAGIYIAANAGFGAGDLRAYFYWNLLFAAFFFSIGYVLIPRFRPPRPALRVAAWVVVGALAGFVWTWIVAALLGPMIHAFSFPILYVWTISGAIGGLVLGWRLRRYTPVLKGHVWLVLLVPPAALLVVFVFYFGLLLGDIYIWGRAEPEVYLIPEGYVGVVYVIFNSPRGTPERYEGGRRVYEIPSTGFLATQFGPNEGWLRDRYYYVTSTGVRKEITGRSYSTIHDTPEARSDTTVVIHGGTRGSASARGCTVKFASFVVGSKAEVLDLKPPPDIGDYLRTHNPCG